MERRMYDRLRNLRGRLEAEDAERRAVEQARRVEPAGGRVRLVPARYACMTCQVGTSMPEKHRGHRLIKR